LVVLVQAGMTPVHAVRVISDLRNLLGIRLEGLPDSQSTSWLQEDVEHLARRLCKAQKALRSFDYDPLSDPQAGQVPNSRWVRTLHMVGSTLGATAGAATIVGNVAAAVASFGAMTGLGLASVIGGGQAMSSAIRSYRESSAGPYPPPTASAATKPPRRK
jgi:hypothetical protein